MILHAEWAGSRYGGFGGFWTLFLEGLTGFIAPTVNVVGTLRRLNITVGIEK